MFFGRRLQTLMTRQWRRARQVWATPSVRDVLWLVGSPSVAFGRCARVPWHIGSGSEQEKVAEASLGLALRVGCLLVIRTSWLVSSVAPTLSTAPQKKSHHSQTDTRGVLAAVIIHSMNKRHSLPGRGPQLKKELLAPQSAFRSTQGIRSVPLLRQRTGALTTDTSRFSVSISPSLATSKVRSVEHGLSQAQSSLWMCSEFTAVHADMHDGDRKTFARESHSYCFCSRAR